MPAWLLTNTFYGQWLPGSSRGSVTSVRDRRRGETELPTREEHDIPGTPVEPPRRGLELAARRAMRYPPVRCDLAMAEILLTQFQETSARRRRPLWAVAIMWNHFHIVVVAPDAPDPDALLADFKSYGSRALNREFSRAAPGRWWTDKGSKNKLPDEAAVVAAVRYVTLEQPKPLVVWSREKGGDCLVVASSLIDCCF